MARLGDFYEDASKVFDVTITYDGSNPDISSDTVTLYLHTPSGTQALSKAADVASEGASGVAKFNLTPANMNVTTGNYIATIKWVTGSDEHILIKEIVDVSELPTFS